ncbi:MAG: Crp/Fnr family transcriptional regulator [Firmicutes bacterium]|nr:Crp/Fnr family transcriptional regulator [Bacillota bacterium]MCM1400880.1 Crp/Fnr family transcriptional regulator [Bacteroides sp.]MCM1476625.1 Crp/Fnr family transcriptional regulator [Bacteroides sp.]
MKSTSIDKIKAPLELPPELEEAFNTITTEKTFRRGETISGIGDLRKHIYYILSGSARVYFIRQGKEHTYSFAFENEYISLSHPLLTDSDYIATIEFLELTTVVTIPFEELHSMLRKLDLATTSIMVKQMFEGLLKQMSALEERLLMMQTCNASERYQWMLNRYPKIFERAKLTQIASFLGVTKETLYRIRGGKY